MYIVVSLVIYVSRLGGCVRRSFYRDNLSHSVYLNQNISSRSGVHSQMQDGEGILTSTKYLDYLAKPDNLTIHS